MRLVGPLVYSQSYRFTPQPAQLLTPATAYLKRAVAKLQPVATVNEPLACWAKHSRPPFTTQRSPLTDLLYMFQRLFGKWFHTLFHVHGPIKFRGLCAESPRYMSPPGNIAHYMCPPDTLICPSTIIS